MATRPARDPRVRNTGFWGLVERQVLRLQDEPERRATALRWAWFISLAVVVLGFMIIVYSLVLAKGAAAHAPDAATNEPDAVPRLAVELLHAGDGATWTVSEEFDFGASSGTRTVDLHAWVPTDARNLAVSPYPPGAYATFALESGNLARVALASNDTIRSLLVQFTVSTPGGALPDLVVPVDAGTLDVRVVAPPGSTPPGPEWTLLADETSAEPGDTWALRVDDARAGERISVTHAPPPPAGGRELVIQLAALSLVTFVLGVAWTARRAPRLAPQEDMGVLDHLRELQARLVGVLLAFVLLAFFFFTFGFTTTTVGGREVPVPTFSIDGSTASIAFRVLVHQFAPEGVSLIVLSPGDAALAQLFMGLFLAFIAVLPYLAYELAAFLGPGLVEKEKAFVRRSVPVVVLLFLSGVAFAWYLMVPVTMSVLYSYATAIGATPFITVGALASFASLMLLLFGATFELPVVMVGLTRLGVVSSRTFASKWRQAVVAIFVLAALVTPDGTGITMVLLALPLLALYVLGIVAARAAERGRPAT